MTLPRLPGIIPADGSAAISGACVHTDTQVQTHTLKHTHSGLPTYNTHKKKVHTRTKKCPQPGYNSKAFIYYIVCLCAHMHVCVPDKEGGWWG